mmetsp:Transcript_33877/g.81486  ORF Transcript_33877/g.81486 Transcript_33877/m.81486 type:complete len:109 (+) Transcript_33877:1923-2249(+)
MSAVRSVLQIDVDSVLLVFFRHDMHDVGTVREATIRQATSLITITTTAVNSTGDEEKSGQRVLVATTFLPPSPIPLLLLLLLSERIDLCIVRTIRPGQKPRSSRLMSS